MTGVKLRFFFGLLVVVTVAKGFDYIEESPFSELSEHSDHYGDWSLENLKVAGGDYVPIKDHAYVVLIRPANTIFSMCAGAIISNTWVITAAHCISTVDITTLTVRAGTQFMDYDGVIFNVTRVVIHNLFNSTTTDYDYGLIQINGSFTFGSTISAILLPAQGSRLGILPLVFTGWGLSMSSSTLFPNNLKAVILPVIPNIVCQLLYGSREIITDTMFCGGKIILGGRGACQGDTGGPIVNKRVLVGIATKGLSCGDVMSPSVFAKVNVVTSWIQGITGISTTG
ncbi:trypsin-7-like [Arctopsyche grandis]|uniref:trypsin-7-like n=1 Tax=Arctopsyche grandis TaxID=121162 RepID=UPI00406D96D9